MKNQEFLNFAEISKVIQFSELLDWLNIAYQKKNNELRGEGFIVSIEKNLFFTPNDNNLKGSVINSAVTGVPKVLYILRIYNVIRLNFWPTTTAQITISPLLRRGAGGEVHTPHSSVFRHQQQTAL